MLSWNFKLIECENDSRRNNNNNFIENITRTEPTYKVPIWLMLIYAIIHNRKMNSIMRKKMRKESM